MPSPCLNQGTCTVGPSNNAVCTCTPGYYGSTCSSSACSINPCKNGGTCNIQSSLANGYYCTCALNYYGAGCSIPNNPNTCELDLSPILCPSFASSNFCSFQYSYNLIPVLDFKI